jgi:hypothetical protein
MDFRSIQGASGSHQRSLSVQVLSLGVVADASSKHATTGLIKALVTVMASTMPYVGRGRNPPYADR